MKKSQNLRKDIAWAMTWKGQEKESRTGAKNHSA